MIVDRTVPLVFCIVPLIYDYSKIGDRPYPYKNIFYPHRDDYMPHGDAL
jgi:hypothetical protein